MSLLEVNKITPQSGTTLTLGDTGDTINFGSGVLPNFENLTVTGDLTVDTNSLYVDSANNRVGIGTTSPTYSLQVDHQGSENVTVVAKGTAPGFGLYDTTTSAYNWALYNSNGDLTFYNTLNTNGFNSLSEKMRISSTGKVGIGTSSPTYKLEVVESGGRARFKFNSTAAFLDIKGGRVDATNNVRLEAGGTVNTYLEYRGYLGHIWDVDSTEVMRIDSSGNVGIGTSSPAFSSGYGGLHISSTYPELRMTGTNSGHTNTDGFKIQYNSSNTAFLWNYENADLGFGTNNSLRMYITSSGNIGIGTASPESPLHITASSSGGANATVLTIGNTDFTAGMTSTIMFEVDTDGPSERDSAQISVTQENGTQSSMRFFTDNGGQAERMRIDSSGNLLVGNTSNNTTQAGVYLNSNGRFFATHSGSSSIFNRLSSDGDILLFQKDTTTVGSIGSIGGAYLYMDTPTASFFRINGTSEVAIAATKMYSPTDARTDLGSSAERFKNLYLSSNIYLGGTTSANALNDYEEGTWTPVIRGTTTAGTATYTTRVARYIKIGKQVFISAYINWTSGTGTGNLDIYDLPFASDSTVNLYQPATIGYFQNITLNTNTTPVAFVNHSGSSNILFIQIPSGGGSNSFVSYDSAGEIMISATYKTN